MVLSPKSKEDRRAHYKPFQMDAGWRERWNLASSQKNSGVDPWLKIEVESGRDLSPSGVLLEWVALNLSERR